MREKEESRSLKVMSVEEIEKVIDMVQEKYGSIHKGYLYKAKSILAQCIRDAQEKLNG